MPRTGEVGLSAVVVVFNEEQFLAECLDRLSFCDEKIVIDLGSKDHSAEVAEAHGAQVLRHEWVPFAEKVRAFGIGQAAFDWIILCDPDLYFPAEAGEALRRLISRYEDDGLGMIYLPMQTWFGDKPLAYGQKGGLRGFRAAIHRNRVRVEGLVHHRGTDLVDPYFALGAPSLNKTPLVHHWVQTFNEAVIKARRYHLYEAESRHALGQAFSWKGMWRELWSSAKQDIRKRAWLDKRSSQVLLFQLWYIWMANMALRASERDEAVLVGSTPGSG
jgi:glycosyltransferase involved in cell wall biosynthesis